MGGKQHLIDSSGLWPNCPIGSEKVWMTQEPHGEKEWLKQVITKRLTHPKFIPAHTILPSSLNHSSIHPLLSCPLTPMIHLHLRVAVRSFLCFPLQYCIALVLFTFCMGLYGLQFASCVLNKSLICGSSSLFFTDITKRCSICLNSNIVRLFKNKKTDVGDVLQFTRKSCQ